VNPGWAEDLGTDCSSTLSKPCLDTAMGRLMPRVDCFSDVLRKVVHYDDSISAEEF